MPIELLHLAFTHYPADPRVKREAQALAATGRRVAAFVLRAPGERAVERIAGVLAVRVPVRKSRGGFLSYLRDYMAFTWRCRRLVARHRRLAGVQVVHVHTLPDFLVWAALPARRRGARVVLDLHEVFPEFTRAKFGGPVGRLLAVVARAVERWARRRADLTLTVNRPIDELLAGRPAGGGRAERRLIVHNSADPAEFGAPPPALLAGRRERAGPVQLVYHGTLTGLYGLDVAIRGVTVAIGRGIPTRLAIIGDGPDRAALVALATELAVADVVRFEPRLPQAALPARLGRCDAGVVPTRLDAMTQYSLSNKLLEYVHLGLPVLAARLPSYGSYFADDAAWYWTPGDPGDLARAIAEFATSAPAERRRRVEAARRGVEEIAWPHESARLVAAYAELLGAPGRAGRQRRPVPALEPSRGGGGIRNLRPTPCAGSQD